MKVIFVLILLAVAVMIYLETQPNAGDIEAFGGFAPYGAEAPDFFAD